jgi:hypothetical protein
MKTRTRTPFLGLFILLAGAALLVPQVAGALPGHSASKAAPVNEAPATFTGCHPHLQISGRVATITPKGCPEGAFLTSYVAHQLVFDPVTAHEQLFAVNRDCSITCSVPLPPCIWQVDYVTAGAALPVIDFNHRYLKRLIVGKLGGAPCTTTTTTAATTTSTTVAASTTSTTVPVTVLGTSIVPPTTNDGTDDATTAVGVLGTQTLPRTGAPHVGMEALLGLGLMALGGSIVGADRRRKRLTA